jgi:hypothetical protein
LANVSVLHHTLPDAGTYPDDGVSPAGANEWREAHDITLTGPALAGKTSAGSGAMAEIPLGTGLAFSSGSLAPDYLFRALSANTAYTNGTSAQNWFASSGAVAVLANTTYLFDGTLHQTTGTTSHTLALSFAGTASLTDITYGAWVAPGAINTTVATAAFTQVRQATSTVVSAAITLAGVMARVVGIVRINAAGTFIPQFTFSVAPGAGNVLSGTYFRMVPLGDGSLTTIGTWT